MSLASVRSVNPLLADKHYLGPTQAGFAWRDEFGAAVFAEPRARHIPAGEGYGFTSKGLGVYRFCACGQVLHFRPDHESEAKRRRSARAHYPPQVTQEGEDVSRTVKPHDYWPDYQAMGDCMVCGNTRDRCEALQREKPQRSADEERRSLAKAAADSGKEEKT